ncbi:FXYD domain-containing ion transport regulator 5 isoform X3 [Elephas maximus indicus]|uniref:FXYD domain-containing ion transport regulator 5 isoform X3 n=1 Tax=Elephas maximus indicus TaxID=99487 RepID=UPI002116D7B6|nr:FXYD domain-containing ion transport regulator 5 isoform X3 [Elephas maximus indicus]
MTEPVRVPARQRSPGHTLLLNAATSAALSLRHCPAGSRPPALTPRGGKRPPEISPCAPDPSLPLSQPPWARRGGRAGSLQSIPERCHPLVACVSSVSLAWFSLPEVRPSPCPPCSPSPKLRPECAAGWAAGQVLEKTTPIPQMEPDTTDSHVLTQVTDTVHPELQSTPQTSTQKTDETTQSQTKAQTRQPTVKDELLTTEDQMDVTGKEDTTLSKRRSPSKDIWTDSPTPRTAAGMPVGLEHNE